MTEAFLLIVQIIFVILDFSFFCFSIIGNSVVIYVISQDSKLKSKSNYHILSVAVADLLIGLPSWDSTWRDRCEFNYCLTFPLIMNLFADLGNYRCTSRLSALPNVKLVFASRVCCLNVVSVSSVIRQIPRRLLSTHLPCARYDADKSHHCFVLDVWNSFWLFACLWMEQRTIQQ